VVRWLWRRIGDALQVHALLTLGLAGAGATLVAWVLAVWGQLPLWIAIPATISGFLILLAVLRMVIPSLVPVNAQSTDSTYRIENIQTNLQITGPGNVINVSSDRVIVTSEGEGPLLPSGTLLNRFTTDAILAIGEGVDSEVIEGHRDAPS
jgi:hypothetical protein